MKKIEDEKLQITRKIERLRVVTYNIHKCRGLDRRVRPSRIVEVLREIDADIIALQEVLSIEGGTPEENQARFIAEGLGLDYRLGENRKLNGGAYGNVILTRLPLIGSCNYDLSHKSREERGCLRTDVELRRRCVLHIFNVHLGTAYMERRHQARRLLDTIILRKGAFTGARIIVGDFNEWTRGLASKLLSQHFNTAGVQVFLGRSRTYPGLLPFLHLDHIYFDESLIVEKTRLHRSRTALIASDHLPIIAEFRFGDNQPLSTLCSSD